MLLGFDGASRAKRARLDATQTMATDIQSTFRHAQRGVMSTLQDVEGTSGRVLSEIANLSTATESHGDASSKSITKLHHATQSLVEEGTKEDVPTGSTPRKRTWNYSDEWELTKPRDILLKDWRQRKPASLEERDPVVYVPSVDDEIKEHPETSDGSDLDADDDLQSTPSLPRSSPISVPSLTSSTSSTSVSTPTSAHTIAPATAPTPVPAAPPPVAARKKPIHATSKSGLPTMGTLTERSTNILAGRRMRGLQR